MLRAVWAHKNPRRFRLSRHPHYIYEPDVEITRAPPLAIIAFDSAKNISANKIAHSNKNAVTQVTQLGYNRRPALYTPTAIMLGRIRQHH